MPDAPLTVAQLREHAECIGECEHGVTILRMAIAWATQEEAKAVAVDALTRGRRLAVGVLTPRERETYAGMRAPPGLPRRLA